jgi:hypothetical protein
MTYENINNLLLKQVDNISKVSANASIQGQIHILKQVMIYLQSEIQKLEKREEDTFINEGTFQEYDYNNEDIEKTL